MAQPKKKYLNSSLSSPNEDLATQYKELFKGKWIFKNLAPRDVGTHQKVYMERGLTMIHIYELVWLWHAGVLDRPGWKGHSYFSRSECKVWHDTDQTCRAAMYGIDIVDNTELGINSFNVCKATYNAQPGKVIMASFSRRVNRLMQVTQEDLAHVVQTGRIPESFFEIRADYLKFEELTDLLQVDKLLLQ